MNRTKQDDETVQLIDELCRGSDDFEGRVKALQEALGKWDVASLAHHLGHVGVIPGLFEHDSAEEKLYAKYCDILVCAFFDLYGMESHLYAQPRARRSKP